MSLRQRVQSASDGAKEENHAITVPDAKKHLIGFKVMVSTHSKRGGSWHFPDPREVLANLS